MEAVDGQVVRESALAGDERGRAAFELFWSAYYRRLCVFALSFRGLPASEREDEVADALIAAFGALSRFDPERPLAPWVYRIARNRFASAVRRARRLSSVGVGPGGGDDDAIDLQARGDHAAETVERDLVERCGVAIAGLPEKDRRIAFLCFFEGFDSKEVGQALGMPAGTVRWRLRGIRARVKAAVGEDSR